MVACWAGGLCFLLRPHRRLRMESFCGLRLPRLGTCRGDLCSGLSEVESILRRRTEGVRGRLLLVRQTLLVLVLACSQDEVFVSMDR